MNVIDKVAPMKERQVKQNFQEWFGMEWNRDRLFKKFKKSKLRIDKDIYNAARHKLQKMIIYKKEHFWKTN